jgi:hypothetical protein
MTVAWYTVRTVVKSPPGVEPWYEERLTAWRATGIDQAIDLAWKETDEYAAAIDGENTGFAQAYGPLDEAPGEGVELFSLIRSSSLPSADYLVRFFSSGSEFQRTD